MGYALASFFLTPYRNPVGDAQKPRKSTTSCKSIQDHWSKGQLGKLSETLLLHEFNAKN